MVRLEGSAHFLRESGKLVVKPLLYPYTSVVSRRSMYKRYVTLSEAKGLFFKEILRLRLRMTG